MAIRSHEDLQVWQEAMKLAEAVYSVSAGFPRDERFGLTSQLRRAAVSIPSNIAEGHARTGTRDFLRFLSMAMGSIAEVRTQLLLAERLGFVAIESSAVLLPHLDEVGRMLRGLMKSLNARLEFQPPTPSP